MTARIRCNQFSETASKKRGDGLSMNTNFKWDKLLIIQQTGVILVLKKVEKCHPPYPLRTLKVPSVDAECGYLPVFLQ